MKKFIPILFAVFAFTSCEKDPDLDKVQDQVVTYTQYDTDENFATASTYYIAPQIIEISQSSSEQTYLPDATATPILNAAIAQMNTRGYTQVSDKADATLGLQMTYIQSTYYFAVNNVGPYWWNSYPYYWNPGYWGGWDNWYYPYFNVFSYTSGSLLTDMVDLSATPSSTSDKLPVVWQAYSIGLLQGSQTQNVQNAVNGVNQAFTQSPYIKRASM